MQLHFFSSEEVGTKVVNQTLKNPLDSAHYFLVADLMFTKNIRFRPLDRLHGQTEVMTIDPFQTKQSVKISLNLSEVRFFYKLPRVASMNTELNQFRGRNQSHNEC